MATNRQENNQDELSSPWLGFAKFLFIVFLTVILLLLARSMVRHHFFSGGQMNQHNVTGP
jgi:ABC-type microcin C transport system permease subunit YejE